MKMIRLTIRTASESLRLPGASIRRLASSQASATSETSSKDDKSLQDTAKETQASKNTTKTVAEADLELMRKLAGISGEGGEAGIEYEDGKPVAMKRSVKNNMFRLI